MGSDCSKTAQGRTLGESEPEQRRSRVETRKPEAAPRADPRLAAAEAAERRLRLVSDLTFIFLRRSLILPQDQTRGTSVANPDRGRLTAQIQAGRSTNKATRVGPHAKEEERLVVSTCKYNRLERRY
jgi:hypothetical protein